MMLVEHQRVDKCQVARLVIQRRRIVLQAKIGVPNNDSVQCDGVLAGVHQAEANVVAAHKHGQRVVFGDVDRKRGVPPRCVIKRNFGRVSDGKLARAQVVFAAKGLQRVDRPKRILGAGLELQPWALFAQHCAVHAQLRVARKCKQRHGSNQRLGLERDVVIHEQHVRCPTLLAQFHQAAGEAASAAQVAVWHHLQRCVWRGIERDVLCVVHHEHAQAPSERGKFGLQLQHVVHSFSHVLLPVERGDGERQSNIVRGRIAGDPLPARHAHLAAIGANAYEVGAVLGCLQGL